MRPLPLILAFLLCAGISAGAQQAGSGPGPDSYLKAGIPSVDREWSGADYTRAAQVLSAGTVALPLYSDPQGAALLRRFTSPDNLAFARNRTLPVRVRLRDNLQMFEGANTILRLYYAAYASKGQGMGAEMASTLAFLVRSAGLTVGLVDELLPALSGDDKYDAERMAALQKINAGMTGMFVGAEITLTEPGSFSAGDRSLVLEAMAATLPQVKGTFTAAYRAQLRDKLLADKAAFSGADDARRLDGMIAELGR